ncbi:MAG: hypothetical protein NT004_16700 [Bacteroidetes bacterium]|nr:hypothetical protein [Bacteroidota bacterium]
MKRLTFLVAIIITCMTAHSQQPVRPDSTANLIKPDSVKRAVETGQVQPVKKQHTAHVRKDTRPLKDRIDWDFNTSFWVNTQQVFFNASILISYKFPKTFSVGAGPVYVFTYRKDVEASLNGIGGQVFAKARLLKFFYLWTAYQGLSNQYLTEVTVSPVSFTWNHRYVDSWFVGAGFNIRLGRRFGINISALYDFLYDKSESPYYNAFIYQFGFSF